MATIRIGTRIFKAAVNQILETKQKVTEYLTKLCSRSKGLAQRVKKALGSFFSNFKKKKPKKSKLILIHAQPKLEKKIKQKRLRKRLKAKKHRCKKAKTKTSSNNMSQTKAATVTQIAEESSQKKAIAVNQPPAMEIEADTIENFYREWEANWGPALTGLDKEFLESASPETISKVIANARLTLKSPYLKAVYNGLKDLQEISDLLEKEEFAKQRIMPFFKDYWDRKPEKFSEVLFCMHDKGVFPTRFGERRLNLDPRLVPEWLGLVS